MQKCPLFWSKLDIFPVFCEILQNPPLFEKIPQFPILKNLSPLLGQKSHKTGKFPPSGHTGTVSQHSLLCWELIFHIFSTQQTQQMLSICRLFVLRFFAWLSSIIEIRLDGRRDFIPTLVYFLEVRFPSSFGLLRFQNQNKSLHKLKTANNLP